MFTTISALILLMVFPSTAFAAASLFLDTPSKTVYRTASFTVTVNVNSGGQPTNSYQARVTYDSNMILPISATSSGTICTLFIVNPTLTASEATVTCGLANPGYSGSAGRLMNLTFSAAKAGTTTLNIDNGSSKILANDGLGTNVMGSSSGLTINIIERPPSAVVIPTPTITSEIGESGTWTSADQIVMKWNKPTGATKFSFLLTTDKNAKPSLDPAKLVSDLTTTLKDLAEGEYYFKVVASNGEEFSDIATYTFNVDRSSPESLDLVIQPSAENPIDTAPIIGFNATDKGSGISRYSISIDGGDFFDSTPPYSFEEITGGEHTITVRAYDLTGNFTEKTLTFSVIRIPPPVIQVPFADSVVQINGMLSISGTGERGTVVLIYLDGELIGTAQVNNEGIFLFDHRTAISDGGHELYVVSRNPGGVLSASSDITNITIQNTLAPVASQSIVDQIKDSNILTICMGTGFVLVIFFILLLFRRRKEVDEIEDRLNEARLEVDQELQNIERKLRDEIEKEPLLGNAQGKKLEHAVSSAIDSTDKAITTLLHPDRIVGAKKQKNISHKKKIKPRSVNPTEVSDHLSTKSSEDVTTVPVRLSGNGSSITPELTRPQDTPDMSTNPYGTITGEQISERSRPSAGLSDDLRSSSLTPVNGVSTLSTTSTPADQRSDTPISTDLPSETVIPPDQRSDTPISTDLPSETVIPQNTLSETLTTVDQHLSDLIKLDSDNSYDQTDQRIASSNTDLSEITPSSNETKDQQPISTDIYGNVSSQTKGRDDLDPSKKPIQGNNTPFPPSYQ
ncbi:hypothetical protein H6763_02410 [Candidatus Nomurabacteria bacterium]|nr:hypothetical protein [Candidatus Nomurabacteria bacterium]